MTTHFIGDQRRLASRLLGVAIAFTVDLTVASPLLFDARLLRGGNDSGADVSRFQHADTVPEGDQVLDVIINGDWSGRWPVPLRRQGEELQASPCYSDELLQALAVDLSRLAAPAREQLQEFDACLPLSALGLDALEQLEFSGLRLNLQIAAQDLLSTPRDYLPPAQWDSGTHAAFVDYRFSAFSQQQRSNGQRWQQSLLALRSGVNIEGWYLRHEGNVQVGDSIEQRYQPVATYVQRDVAPWTAQLTLGEAYSSGQVNDSIGFLGLGLGSDERMLPASQRGFAPTVSGVAYSTALLTIRQRGVVLHESTVQPGPFEITDLYANAFSDDLEVSLREADGNERTFTVPYQAAPLALRPGVRRFDFSLGYWRNGLGDTGPLHFQGSWLQGLNNLFSVHSGLIGADNYQSAALGAAVNSPLGAVGLTATASGTQLSEQRQSSGQALRLHWRQVIAQSMTHLSASLTSSSQHYTSFNDFAYAQRDAERRGYSAQSSRLRASLAVNQGLGEQWGRFNLQVTRTQRWGQSGSDLGYTLGYYHRYGSLGYGLSASREHYASTGRRNHLSLTLSMPLGESRRSALSSSLTSNGQGQHTTTSRLSSTTGDYGEWGYGLGLSTLHDSQRNTAGVDANLRYRGPGVDVSGALTNHNDYRQASLGARGAIVGHSGGVTSAQSLSESFAIVHAPGAANARIKQAQQVRLDSRGYGVLPHLTPYSLNTVELDPKGTSQDVELQISSQQVVPRAGAATLLYYPTRSGRSAVIDARMADGGTLPFGAQVLDESGEELGMVGQGSRLHVRGVNEQGQLQVRWGGSAQQQCSIAYQLPEAKSKGNGPLQLTALCEQLL